MQDPIELAVEIRPTQSTTVSSMPNAPRVRTYDVEDAVTGRDVRQECVPESLTFVSAFHQPGNVGDYNTQSSTTHAIGHGKSSQLSNTYRSRESLLATAASTSLTVEIRRHFAFWLVQRTQVRKTLIRHRYSGFRRINGAQGKVFLQQRVTATFRHDDQHGIYASIRRQRTIVDDNHRKSDVPPEPPSKPTMTRQSRNEPPE